ncbi:MAG: guanylate kinase [Rickettsiales bacterium]|nr:guanylate kinase [Rickettsiales bacterium]OUV53773.1 MAG: guanylate kinase [Rickettsiales bacterium TMED127]|tara:strand:- start:76093 stop:76710 length:618 start_codon:yes stop_codon:yes gene_type:complete
MINKKGILFVLSSPSGAGKTTLCKKILSLDKNLRMSISYTTRPKRRSEKNGKDYYFISNDEFLKKKNKHEFIETATVFENNYGTPKKFIQESISKGLDIIFDIDWQGAQKLVNFSSANLVSIFILPPSTDELKKRLKKRAEDTKETVEKRMSKAKSEISHWVEYDYVLVNDDLEKCVEQILNIIKAERLKRVRQKNLFDHIEKFS